MPNLIKLGFPLQGVGFDWDEVVNYTHVEQREMERMLIQYHKIDPTYLLSCLESFEKGGASLHSG